MRRDRPKNLNLFTIRLPINAVVSIMHRMSGVALYAVLPVALWMLSTSLSSVDGYEQAKSVVTHWTLKIGFLALSWAFFHHFYAGLRHLAHDLHWFHSLKQARNTSRLLILLDVISVTWFATWLW